MNLLLVILVCVTAAVHASNSDLLLVVTVYRHGDRTPTDFPPNDIYKDPKYWNTEPGELTNRGKQQQYSLGRWFRERYNGFLPATYHKEDIYVRSSPTDRCLMSAAANLAGLYPPSGDQIWSTIQWMPIPIHSIASEEKGLLRMGRACPNFEAKYQAVLKNENFTAIDKENSELYEYLSKNLGEEIKQFSDIEAPYDTMSIEMEYNMKLPDWTHKILRDGMRVFPDEMKKWADLSYRTPTYTKELARLGTGRFFDMLASNFEAAAKNDTKNMLGDKMIMFSGHKSTICDLTNTLGVFKLTPYAGALIFELRRNPNTKKDYVNVFFKEANSLDKLKIDGCDVDCDFNEFLKILESYRMNENQWKSECLSGATAAVTVSSALLIFLFSILHNLM